MRKRKGSIALTVIAVICLAVGLGLLWSVYNDGRQKQQSSDTAVAALEEQINSSPTPAPSAQTQTTTTPAPTADTVPGGALGVLYIPSFYNFRHVIAAGVDKGVLKNYVGMYQTYSEPGRNGMCVLAAHSTPMEGGRSFAFFNRLEGVVKVGDDVSILWHDGKKYQYRVTGVSAWVPSNQEQAFFDTHNDKNRQTLILQTCTHGNGNYRSFIVCEPVQ